MSKTRKFEEVIQSLAVLDTRKKVEMAKMLIRQNQEILEWNLRTPYCTVCKESMSGRSDLSCRKCDRHTIPAGNSLEYVLLVYNLAKKLRGESGDFILDMIDFFKDRGVKFQSTIKGPLAKHGATPYLYVKNSFRLPKSPIYEKSLSTDQRAIIGCIMMATKDDSKPAGSRKLLVISNGRDEEYIDATPQKNKRRSTTQSSYQPVIENDTPSKRLKVVSNESEELIDYSNSSKRRSMTNESNYQPVIKQETMPKRQKRVRYDSGRGSLKSPNDVKVENRTPPLYAESVGSKEELTPDEFYAHSLRLDFPRSTLGS